MRTPRFWYRQKTFLGRVLNPIGRLYAWSVARRFRRTRPYQADIPVVCVGNLNGGGTGKTPVCLALGQILSRWQIPFFFLNHGYKSRRTGVLVDREHMTALDVGDEALLMAAMAPTVVDNHRARGAQLIQRLGGKALIMDDGFQNPTLIKTLSLIIVDGQTGFGNGRVIPAGPLREPVARGLKRADAVVIAGADTSGVANEVRSLNPEMPILTGHFQPDTVVMDSLRGKTVVAFAGIGRPDKFFAMLSEAGVVLSRHLSFPDHYFYTRFDIEQVLADAGGMPVVTTEKDYVKIPRDLQSRVTVVPGQFAFDDEASVEALLRGGITG